MSNTLQPYYECYGSGPNLVLLHGWGLHGGIFKHLYEALGQHFRIINIDLPGFGRSPIANTEYTLDYLKEQVLSVVPEKAHYLGWSLGGLLAKAIAIEHTQTVDKLITVASSPYFLMRNDWPYAMKPEVMQNFFQLLEEDYEATLIRFLSIQTLGSETHREDIKHLKETVFIHGKPAPKALSGGLELLEKTDIRDRLQDIQQDYLRVYGQLDSLVPAKVSEMIDDMIPHSQKVIINKASHAPFLSHKHQFTQEVISFLLGDSSC